MREKATSDKPASVSTKPIHIAGQATAPSNIALHVANGEIIGTVDTQEYSLDGGTTWHDATESTTSVVFEGGESVVIREKATASQVASIETVAIHVVERAVAPSNIAIHVANDEIIGTTDTQEYSLDGGSTWRDATESTTSVVFEGGEFVVVREKATASQVASTETVSIHVAERAAAPANIAIHVANSQITGTTATQEYSLDGRSTWRDAAESATSVVFEGGESVVVREKATASQVASTGTTVVDIAERAEAPLNIVINVEYGHILMTNQTQEYSLDGGSTWHAASNNVTTVVFNGGESVVVREKATANQLASIETVAINVAEKAAAPSNIVIDVANGEIKGTTTTQEYSSDGGLTWHAASALVTPVVFDGGKPIVVREKATATRVASYSTPVRVEAEHATHNTGWSFDQKSSNGAYLHSFNEVGKYIDFSGILKNGAEVKFFTMSYASPSAGKIGLYINGKRHDFQFERSDSFSEATMAITIPANATVKLQFDAGDQWINLDYVEYCY